MSSWPAARTERCTSVFKNISQQCASAGSAGSAGENATCGLGRADADEEQTQQTQLERCRHDLERSDGDGRAPGTDGDAASCERPKNQKTPVCMSSISSCFRSASGAGGERKTRRPRLGWKFGRASQAAQPGTPRTSSQLFGSAISDATAAAVLGLGCEQGSIESSRGTVVRWPLTACRWPQRACT